MADDTHKHTIVLDTRGPQTREEFWDAVKAFTILRGSEPTAIEVPMATYRVWAKWSPDEKGSDAANAPPTMAAVPEMFGGMRLSITSQFRMY